ncbi:putative DNA-binding domain-containing protein (plasmid) [Klebsiella pneumoniae]|uniref:Putative DNA-binding domain-containing protein n=1 Tax=Salmonella enterica TaxID=28901 RepID=A0A743JWC5_SALER|nr:putative DNA-binding domain-containing protein [Klebsiella pneumoniae]HAF1690107.1 hypothetical protein [Salmonella enterica]HBV9912674.1 hypothetical protein [Klebsiella aerogenes]MBS8179451.1 putative DNA-binding domain-containing protein [Klebsiella pneumoniae]MBT1552497.1 putative DNA-binding domain-containing protein [Klebsiella pneumoniae]MBT1663604.1 putative DNA-binding domain-containing protein [Klebsiella pneumoniae]
MTVSHSVPASLAKAEADFAARLRARSTGNDTCPRGLALYRKIVRENICGVIQNVFPLFCRNLDNAGLDDLTDAFIHQHRASQPEFHQVATELLMFIRQQSNVSYQNNALIEYEWLMYAVEIDDSEVPQAQEIMFSTGLINNAYIEINPTLKIISLPFWLKEGEPCYDDSNMLHYYAIFRKNDKTIWQRKLNQNDVIILSEIKNSPMPIKALQDKVATLFPEMSFFSWLELGHNDELFSLTFKV